MAKVEAAVTPEHREILPIKPIAVTIDFITHSRKFVIVEVDPTLTLQDFNDRPNIWRLVQQDRNKAVAANDVIELRASDWTAFAKVNCIATDEVHLYDIHRATRPPRTVALYEDTKYRIGMVGSRYAVFSKTGDTLNPARRQDLRDRQTGRAIPKFAICGQGRLEPCQSIDQIGTMAKVAQLSQPTTTQARPGSPISA